MTMAIKVKILPRDEIRARSTRVRRVAPGAYAVGSGDYTVTVDRCDWTSGPDKWIARADWTSHTVTDPLSTKRDAVQSAVFMIEHAESYWNFVSDADSEKG